MSKRVGQITLCKCLNIIFWTNYLIFVYYFVLRKFTEVNKTNSINSSAFYTFELKH